jgi:hypothetical protein
VASTRAADPDQSDVQRVEISGDGWTVDALAPVATKAGDDASLVVRPGVLQECACESHDAETHRWEGLVEKVRLIGDRERVSIAFADTTLTLERPAEHAATRVGDHIALCGRARSLWAVSADDEAAR